VDVENAGNAGQFSICVNTGFDEPSYAVVESISDDINTCLGSFHTLIGDNPDYTTPEEWQVLNTYPSDDLSQQ
jgi:hypothetical protein